MNDKAKRCDSRTADQLRPVTITSGFLRNPAGSAMIECGGTRILCAASIAEDVPGWMKAQKVKGGWITGEYQMLPASTNTRSKRENKSGPGGRSQEIQRLIGRSLRAAVDLEALGQRMIYIDCDVLDADGGTRCAGITGGMVALKLAINTLLESGELKVDPIKYNIAAVSVGIVDGKPLLDLCYEEDCGADVDMNVVMADNGQLIEVQATAEGAPFSKKELDKMLDLADIGLKQLFEAQKKATL
jgi:ribonuclease PH